MRSWGMHCIGSVDQNIYVVTLQTDCVFHLPGYISCTIFKTRYHLKSLNTIHVNILLAKTVNIGEKGSELWEQALHWVYNEDFAQLALN